MTTIISAGFLDTRQVCDRLGVAPALLRLWESRYGWPAPRRSAQGQRRFTEEEVAELGQVLALITAGRSIGSLIVDGRPRLPRLEPESRQPLGTQALAACPTPETEFGQRLRDHVVAALRRRDTGSALASCHQAMRHCRPSDRNAAVREPVLALCKAWSDAGRPLAQAAELCAAAEALVGSHAVELAS